MSTAGRPCATRSCSCHNTISQPTGLLAGNVRSLDSIYVVVHQILHMITSHCPAYFSACQCSTSSAILSYFDFTNASSVFSISVRKPEATKCPKGNLWLLSFPSTVRSFSEFRPLWTNPQCVDSFIEDHSVDGLNGQRTHHNLDFITQNKHIASGLELLSLCQSVLKFNRL